MTTVTRNASGDPQRPYDEVDISSRAFWSTTADERERSFAVLREQRPFSWHPPFEDQLLDDPEDHGFWAVTTHDDVVEVTRRHEDFLSGHGILMENLPPEIVESTQSIIGMDPPRHDQLRRLVSSAFTVKQMKRLEDRIEANAAAVVDNLLEKARRADDGVVDFVAECAALLPMHNINDILGVYDGDEREETAHRAAVGIAWNDPDTMGEQDKNAILERLLDGVTATHELASSLVARRRREPADDVLTALAQAEIDGTRLTDDEIGAFFVLLTIAGNDTTRQSISHGLKALTDHPDQRSWLLDDLDRRIESAVEELVRWATPIMTFRRTAARDLDFRGRRIGEGDKVVLFYSSANRDGSLIERPDELDLSRDPNPHLGFGGGGIHHCLGNQLARFQLRALFTELLTRAPGIRSGDPVLVPGTFIHQVKSLPCRVDPAAG
jgi:cytochrome P450